MGRPRRVRHGARTQRVPHCPGVEPREGQRTGPLVSGGGADVHPGRADRDDVVLVAGVRRASAPPPSSLPSSPVRSSSVRRLPDRAARKPQQARTPHRLHLRTRLSRAGDEARPEGVTASSSTRASTHRCGTSPQTLRTRPRVVVCGSHARSDGRTHQQLVVRLRGGDLRESGSTRRGMRRCIDLAAAGGIRPAIDSVRPSAASGRHDAEPGFEAQHRQDRPARIGRRQPGRRLTAHSARFRIPSRLPA